MIQFGDFVITFSFGSNPKCTDFITADNLKSLALFYMAGNYRPILYMTFTLENNELIKYLNAGNILTMSFGDREPSTQEAVQFELFSDDSSKNFTVGYEVALKAAFYKSKFTNKLGCKSYPNSLSVDVIKEIATNNGFNFLTNTTKTNDLQLWYRCGTTEWNFMNELWYHSYINDDTFLAYGMDCDNIYFYDVKNLVKQGVKWVVTTNRQEATPNTLLVGSVSVTNNYGTYKDLIGNNLLLSEYNLDVGDLTVNTYKLKSFTTIDTDSLPINSANALDYTYAVTSDDVHKNYNKAINQNIRNNLLYSTVQIYTSAAAVANKIRLFDTVQFDINPIDDRLQGLAFITGICYQYEQGNFRTNLTISKEAVSGLRGDFLNGIE